MPKIIDDFITAEKCQELIHIAKSVCTQGHLPHVQAANVDTILHLQPCLLVPLLETRVEENFDCQYSLHVEFTGLLSWGTGARIDWHYDSNRPYLKQRHYTAVLYLNSAGFTGGDLLFQLPGGNVQRMTPQAGRAVMYEAGACSVHAVDQVTSGERHTLAMWFTKVVP
eukprot:gene5072-6174_t